MTMPCTGQLHSASRCQANVQLMQKQVHTQMTSPAGIFHAFDTWSCIVHMSGNFFFGGNFLGLMRSNGKGHLC